MVLTQNEKKRVVTLPIRLYAHEWEEERKTIRTEGTATRRNRELIRVKALLEQETSMFREVVAELEAKQGHEGYSLHDVLDLRKRWRWKNSFFEWMNCRIRGLHHAGQHSTAENYQSALVNFMTFRHGKDLPLSDMTVALMKDFQKHLLRKGLSMNTISLYNRNLRAVYNQALDEELLDEDKRPFHKVFTGIKKTRKRAVKSDVVRRLINLHLADNQALELTRDVFLFCIYTQGMAFVDAAHLTTDNVCHTQLTYRRHKTGQNIRIELPECARDLVRRYHRETDSPSYLLPLLYNPLDNKRVKYATALRTYNRRLHQISERMGLEVPLSSYVARHTWASIAKHSGVAPMIISEAMGHDNINTTIIYLDELDVEVVSAANRLVVDSLFSH